MQVYDAMLRLGGDVLNSIPKDNITASEILCLQAIHGADALVDIKPRKMDKRAHNEERARLEMTYGSKVVMQLFGAPYGSAKLPIKVEDFRGVVPNMEGEDEDLNTFKIDGGPQ